MKNKLITFGLTLGLLFFGLNGYCQSLIHRPEIIKPPIVISDVQKTKIINHIDFTSITNVDNIRFLSISHDNKVRLVTSNQQTYNFSITDSQKTSVIQDISPTNTVPLSTIKAIHVLENRAYIVYFN